MNITIVKPDLKHAEAIATICSTGWKQTVEGLLSDEYQKKNVEFWYNLDRVCKDITSGAYSHVALVNSEVVGVIGGGMTGPHVGEVFVLYVDESYRYRGIGRRLLEALSQQQLVQGATEQWVSVQKGNQRGIPFYEARKFVFHEEKTTWTETNEKQVSLRYSRPLSYRG
ncbi:Ribosomal protein S18 acetylase RimI [Mesobacillus persicus]|uniref:Ribosomal protein S18 acetylase RimI n=1 Tax=Mesobacillus persicus TaxID=930146 RepID=A0A1H8KX48_9BACI|nr:GNAT family N-acetyltransferase [Mesobacillus persicus]SEN97502.1 Ribosomal protein S18 acetylase RimI [Mesobacillus persicus]